jgi:hypothetical protein
MMETVGEFNLESLVGHRVRLPFRVTEKAPVQYVERTVLGHGYGVDRKFLDLDVEQRGTAREWWLRRYRWWLSPEDEIEIVR